MTIVGKDNGARMHLAQGRGHDPNSKVERSGTHEFGIVYPDPASDLTRTADTTFLCRILVMAMCDQWWTPDKTDLNKSSYLWLPIDLNPKMGAVKMKYHKTLKIVY
jgi:hypothetical protein